jgi:HD-like signal output (HDOD) protein
MEQHVILNRIKESGSLPEIPKYFGEILKMLLEPVEYDIDECVERFSHYPQLGDALIKILNYNVKLQRKIDNVKDAINYLGAKKARMIAVAYITRVVLPEKDSKDKQVNIKK